MNTLIRVVEVWMPSNDRSYLEYSGGLHGSASRFGAASPARRFGRGEGLGTGKPIVLKQFDGSYFRLATARSPSHPRRTGGNPHE